MLFRGRNGTNSTMQLLAHTSACFCAHQGAVRAPSSSIALYLCYFWAEMALIVWQHANQPARLPGRGTPRVGQQGGQWYYNYAISAWEWHCGAGATLAAPRVSGRSCVRRRARAEKISKCVLAVP